MNKILDKIVFIVALLPTAVGFVMLLIVNIFKLIAKLFKPFEQPWFRLKLRVYSKVNQWIGKI